MKVFFAAEFTRTLDKPSAGKAERVRVVTVQAIELKEVISFF